MKLFTIQCEESNSDCYWPLPVPFNCVFPEAQLKEAEKLVEDLNHVKDLCTSPTYHHYKVVELLDGIPKVLTVPKTISVALTYKWHKLNWYIYSTREYSSGWEMESDELLLDLPFHGQTKEELLKEIDTFLMEHIDLLVKLTHKEK